MKSSILPYRNQKTIYRKIITSLFISTYYNIITSDNNYHTGTAG